jgi:hypothetical protein
MWTKASAISPRVTGLYTTMSPFSRISAQDLRNRRWTTNGLNESPEHPALLDDKYLSLKTIPLRRETTLMYFPVA